jgi:cold shock CspA family protein
MGMGDVMAQGRVDWYSVNLGYGFIYPQGQDPRETKIFMSREDIKAGEEEKMENNAWVSYEVVQGTEGPEARGVSRI